MDRRELTDRLGKVRTDLTTAPCVGLILADVERLLEDIELDGVLDVQMPPPLPRNIVRSNDVFAPPGSAVWDGRKHG